MTSTWSSKPAKANKFHVVLRIDGAIDDFWMWPTIEEAEKEFDKFINHFQSMEPSGNFRSYDLRIIEYSGGGLWTERRKQTGDIT